MNTSETSTSDTPRGAPRGATDWGDVPEEDRLSWSSTLLDFIAWQSPIVGLVLSAPRILAGDPPENLVAIAREMHAVGFTPIEYHLLCTIISGWNKRGDLTEEEHGHLFRRWLSSRPVDFFELDPEAWALWVPLVRSGLSPRRATEYVLTGGHPLPRRMMLEGPGTRRGVENGIIEGVLRHFRDGTTGTFHGVVGDSTVEGVVVGD